MSKWNSRDFYNWIARGCKKVDVEYLNFSCLHLTELPHQLFNLTSLKILEINNNKLSIIPPEIGQLTNLERLIAYCNQISNLPVEIGNLKKLKSLWLFRNKLEYLPSAIGNLTDLEVLCFSTNLVLVLPSEICNLVKLQIFDCSDNNLTNLPEDIGRLESLEFLNVSKNQITALPPSIGMLQRLKVLEANDNHITMLPFEIGALCGMYRFDISINNISVLTDGIGNLRSIKCINCAYNELTFIPTTIGRLSTLLMLQIDNNNITALPAELGNCHNLVECSYVGNPVEYIPPNVHRMLNRRIATTRPDVYNDAQSVHKSSIQQAVKKSIITLLKDKPKFDYDNVLEQILADDILSETTKQSLSEYSTDTDIHSILQITFGELLVAVWNRIVSNEHSSEIKQILNSEMSDALCMCFTGRISRLINCLNGFDSDVNIGLDDSEQIGTIIIIVKQQLGADYTLEKHRHVVTERLQELGYSDGVIAEWIAFIS